MCFRSADLPALRARAGPPRGRRRCGPESSPHWGTCWGASGPRLTRNRAFVCLKTDRLCILVRASLQGQGLSSCGEPHCIYLCRPREMLSDRTSRSYRSQELALREKRSFRITFLFERGSTRAYLVVIIHKLDSFPSRDVIRQASFTVPKATCYSWKQASWNPRAKSHWHLV